MTQRVFSSDLKKFALEHSIPQPGAVTRNGAPLAKNSASFSTALKNQEQLLFEKLLLFDTVQLSVTGPNVIAPLLYERMGARTFEELLEQDAIMFVIWEPEPMITHKDGRVGALFMGRIDQGGPIDIERRIDDGLLIGNPSGLNTAGRRSLKNKLMRQHSILDARLGEEAWTSVIRAAAEGSLVDLGVEQKSDFIGTPLHEGMKLSEACGSLLAYQHILANNLSCFDDVSVFDLFARGLSDLENSTLPIKQFGTIAKFEKFPNLRDLYDEIDAPFRRATKFRMSNHACNFRAWLSTLKAESEIDIIREYVDAFVERRGLFESNPAKLLKSVTMTALGSAGAAALGLGPASSVAAGIAGAAAEYGLGLIDTFILDNIKIGWSPKAYFSGLRRLREKGQNTGGTSH
jgi:hypothetical protein